VGRDGLCLDSDLFHILCKCRWTPFLESLFFGLAEKRDLYFLVLVWQTSYMNDERKWKGNFKSASFGSFLLTVELD